MALRKENLGNNDDKKEQKTKRTRITIDVSPELRRRIKSAALQKDISISEYLGRVLEETIPDVANTMQQRGHPATHEAIERLRRLREQIAKENKGGPFEDSTELIRQMREERTRYLMGEL